ncbi:MAG: hypothetical protein VKI81_06500, partial [Synechococcaceae cyanobacterium]|nr:hypothetical protein [Synechococcaceae cyanobacterium]
GSAAPLSISEPSCHDVVMRVWGVRDACNKGHASGNRGGEESGKATDCLHGSAPILDHDLAHEFPLASQPDGRRKHRFLTVPAHDTGVDGRLEGIRRVRIRRLHTGHARD